MGSPGLGESRGRGTVRASGTPCSGPIPPVNFTCQPPGGSLELRSQRIHHAQCPHFLLPLLGSAPARLEAGGAQPVPGWGHVWPLTSLPPSPAAGSPWRGDCSTPSWDRPRPSCWYGPLPLWPGLSPSPTPRPGLQLGLLLHQGHPGQQGPVGPSAQPGSFPWAQLAWRLCSGPVPVRRPVRV